MSIHAPSDMFTADRFLGTLRQPMPGGPASHGAVLAFGSEHRWNRPTHSGIHAQSPERKEPLPKAASSTEIDPARGAGAYTWVPLTRDAEYRIGKMPPGILLT